MCVSDHPARDGLHHFVLDPDGDSGLLCRVLGLYAARGISIRALRAQADEQGLVRLEVEASLGAETGRVLLAKAATLLGVLQAGDPAH
jgi:hypothetical protein